ncbi:MAG: hypothetical protein ACOX8R_08105 [Bacillota bacterium]
MKKIFFGVSLLLIAAVFAGCGFPWGEGAGEPENSRLVELTDSGYYLLQNETVIGVYWGVELENTDEEQASQPFVLTATAYDESGAAVGSGEVTVESLEAGELRGCAGVITCDAVPAAVEYTFDDPAPLGESDFFFSRESFRLTDVSELKDDHGVFKETDVTGNITNASETKAESFTVFLLLKKEEQIVFGNAYIGMSLDAGQKVSFGFTIFDPPEYDSYELYYSGETE